MRSSGGSSHIKREFARVGVFRRRVWNDHLCRGKAVEDRSNDPVVVVRDCREYNTLSVTEGYGGFNVIVDNCYRRHACSQMCIFHFCHSSSLPLILKLTPSG